MSEQLANTFIEALRALEANRDVGPLAALYGEDAQVGNLIAPDKFTGKEGARAFWTEYRGTFETVESTFRSIVSTKDRAALEWTTTGTGFDGGALTYAGVTILEAEGGQITRSCAYFNPGALGRQIAP